MEGCNKGKNEMEKRKKNGKKTTTQDAQSHRKCMQRTTQKPGRGRGERLDCEPEGQTPPSPSVSHSPCIPCPVPRMGSEGAGKPMCLPPHPQLSGLTVHNTEGDACRNQGLIQVWGHRSQGQAERRVKGVKYQRVTGAGEGFRWVGGHNLYIEVGYQGPKV